MVDRKEKTEAKSETAVFSRRKKETGTVLSDKMDKTVVIAVTRQVKHPEYGKYVRKTKKYYAHDESNACQVGDVVKIVESRPLSRLKRWKVEQVIRKAL